MSPTIEQDDVFGATCAECALGVTVFSDDRRTQIYICYHAGSDNYMEVHGEHFHCVDGEAENVNNS